MNFFRLIVLWISSKDLLTRNIFACLQTWKYGHHKKTSSVYGQIEKKNIVESFWSVCVGGAPLFGFRIVMFLEGTCYLLIQKSYIPYISVLFSSLFSTILRSILNLFLPYCYHHSSRGQVIRPDFLTGYHIQTSVVKNY